MNIGHYSYHPYTGSCELTAPGGEHVREPLNLITLEQLEAAVKQERERCLAAIDDIWQPDITMVEITDAIRALNNPPDPDVDNPLTTGGDR